MSKRRNFTRLIFIGSVTLALCCCFTLPTQAGVVTSDTTVSQATPWDGFGPDFEPEWKGETTTVTAWSSYINNSGDTLYGGTLYISSGGTLSCGNLALLGNNWQYGVINGHWETRPTVRKVSSSSHSKVTNSTVIQIGEDEFTAEKNGSGGSSMARYAELISPDKELLANASSIAYKTARFNDDDFSASGRVSSFALLSTATLSTQNEAPEPSVVEVSDPVTQSTPVAIECLSVIPEMCDFKTQGCKQPGARDPFLDIKELTISKSSADSTELTLYEVPCVFEPAQIVVLAPTLTVDSILNETSSLNPTLTGDLEKAEAQACGQAWFDSTYELDLATDFSLELDIARLGEVDISFSVTDLATNEETFLLPALEPEGSQTVSIDGTLEAGIYEFRLYCETTALLDNTGNCDLGGEAEFDLTFDLKEEYVEVWVPESGLAAFLNAINDDTISAFGNDSSLIFYDLQEESAGSVMADSQSSGLMVPMAVVIVPEPSTLVMLVLGGLTCLLAFCRHRYERTRR